MKIFRLDYSFYDDAMTDLISHEEDKPYEVFLSDFRECCQLAGEKCITEDRYPSILDIFCDAITLMRSKFNYKSYKPDTISFWGELLDIGDYMPDKGKEYILDEKEGSDIEKCLGKDLEERLLKQLEKKTEILNKKMNEEFNDGK